METRAGFAPAIGGFADRCLGLLGYRAEMAVGRGIEPLSGETATPFQVEFLVHSDPYHDDEKLRRGREPKPASR